jgi:5'-methylthioadenosine phosphorylase
MPHLLILAIPMPPPAIDVLGDVVETRDIETPFGPVESLARRVCDQCGAEVWVLPYFGAPTRTDPRATIWAAKDLGVQRILAVESMVGLDHSLTRGDLVLPADYIDWTKRQPTTFFERTGAGYISQNPPFCPEISAAIRAHLPQARPVIYLGDEGPRRETAAEARMFQQWGVQARGLNLVPETYLAKEMELCFAAIGVIVAHGADRARASGAGEVREATRIVLEALPGILASLPDPPACGCNHLQDGARQRGILPPNWREWQ